MHIKNLYTFKGNVNHKVLVIPFLGSCKKQKFKQYVTFYKNILGEEVCIDLFFHDDIFDSYFPYKKLKNISKNEIHSYDFIHCSSIGTVVISRLGYHGYNLKPTTVIIMDSGPINFTDINIYVYAMKFNKVLCKIGLKYYKIKSKLLRNENIKKISKYGIKKIPNKKIFLINFLTDKFIDKDYFYKYVYDSKNSHVIEFNESKHNKIITDENNIKEIKVKIKDFLF